MEIIGGREGRVSTEGSAVERRAFEGPEKRRAVAEDTGAKTDKHEDSVAEFRLDGSPSTPNDYISVAGGEVGAQEPERDIEATALQHQRQGTRWFHPVALTSEEVEVGDESDTPVSDQPILAAIEEHNQLEEGDAHSADSRATSLITDTEDGIQDDLQDIEEVDSKVSQSLPSFEEIPPAQENSDTADSSVALPATNPGQDTHNAAQDIRASGAEATQISRDSERGPRDNPEISESMDFLNDKSSRLDLDSQARLELEQAPINRTIHILGLAAAGKYIAHSIASLPFAPPVTLLMHRPLMMQLWHDEGAAIRVMKGEKLKTQSNFHIESSADFGDGEAPQRYPGFGPNLEHTAEPPTYPIDTLIVTTESYRTVSALRAVKNRLRKGSIVFLVNDGLGLAEKLNETVFTDPSYRPIYILGNMTHTLQSTERQYTLIAKKIGRLECSKLPQVLVSRRERWDAPVIIREDYSWNPYASHLVGTLARTPELCTLTLGHKWFIEKRLEDLAAGAVIGPLSVLFDCSNDLLLYNYSASQIMKPLIAEISRVIRNLPELQSFDNLDKRFNVKRLNAIITSKIMKTGNNTSTMLQRVRAGHRTDIDYFNGYIERRARELRIYTPRNHMIIDMVKGKGQARSREINNYIPFQDRY
ncbi:uncharacterized protein RCO7_09157 [Rhynchosporium graminicola]|uniref:2-dehydropantoate 2-reductase n=1 Tax=Rhynchosporium graminicola TaxID=2792576 RepID=A0A1E1L3A3_9HELO|nr:uncharacterized protein RCO7_09157 [Rhynchosporium commune]